MTTELYKTYRPSSLKRIMGQPDAVRTLEGLISKNKIPHFILFAGPSGCGKTTLARILKKHLKCGDQDFAEINCADLRGIDTVRDIRSRMGLAPINGDCRIWLIDEAHQLTTQAQDAFLKILEDTPEHVYFMMATTDPNKLKPTVRTRATTVTVKAMAPVAQKAMIEAILTKEDKTLTEEVIEKIVETAEGSARKALVILNAIINIDDETEQLNAIASTDVTRDAIEIARKLLDNRTKWPEMARLLKSVDDDPESIRWLILSYMSNVLLSGKAMQRAYACLNAFRDNFYDSKKAGLVAACYEVIHSV